MTKRPHINSELIQRVLGTSFLQLSLRNLTLREDCQNGVSSVTVEVSDSSGNQFEVEGEGLGLMGALLSGLRARYAVEYQSLKTIELIGFAVEARLDTKKDNSGVDAIGEVSIDIRNSRGTVFTFSDESRSVASSMARAVLAAVEYFVNAERAFITLYKSLKDAKNRNRTDLVTRYTQELAEVVKSTSYAEIIESIQRELE